MSIYKISELILDKISGEWGKEGLSEDAVKVIRTANFTNTGEIDYEKIVRRNIQLKKVEQKKLKRGDILIEKSGGGPKQPVGRVVYFDPKKSDVYLCNNFSSVLRPNPKIVQSRFLFYTLFFSYKIGKVLNYQNKTTGIINLKLDRYLSEKVDVPNLKTQEQIVAILDKAQNLVRKREESIALLDELVKATFLELFGDPVLNEKGLEMKKLSELGNWKSGGTPLRSVSKYYEGKIPWFSSGELNTMFVSESKEKITEIALNESSAKRIEVGSLMVGMYDTAALKSSITKVIAACNQAIAFSQLNETLCSPVYVYFAIQLGRDYHLSKRRGVRQRNLNLGMIKALEIPIPLLKEQQNFENFVIRSEFQKKRLQESLHQANNLFQSLLQDAFNEKLEFNAHKGKIDQALKKVAWLDEQLNEVTGNNAIEQLQKNIRAITENPSFKAVQEIQERLKRYQIPNLASIEKFQQALDKMNTPMLKAVQSSLEFQALQRNPFLQQITEGQPFALKTYEAQQEAAEQEEREQEIAAENDPVIQFINENQIGWATLEKYQLNLAKIIYTTFEKREFDVEAVVQVLKEKGIKHLRRPSVKKEVINLLKEIVLAIYVKAGWDTGFFGFKDMRKKMRETGFNPAFELLQELMDNGLKNGTIEQKYINTLPRDFSDPYYRSFSKSEIQKILEDDEGRIFLTIKKE